MKYIRAKDGFILKFSKEIKSDIKEFGWISILGCLENDTKQSDRLEDLFDEQIVEYKDKNGKVVKREFVNHIYDGEIPEGEPEYYGAIRTIKGLQYVARKIEGKWILI